MRDKKLLGSIFLTTFIICAVAYGAIAVLVANYFGPHMAQVGERDRPVRSLVGRWVHRLNDVADCEVWSG